MSGYDRQATIPCPYCKNKYVYHDSMERHCRAQHGTAYEREVAREARRWQTEQRKRLRRAEKHRALCAEVVKQALAWYRQEWLDAPLLVLACEKLERFETKGRM